MPKEISIIAGFRDIPHLVYQVIKYGVLLCVIVGFSILFVGSLLVYDTTYIVKNPKFFVSETLLMAILTAIPVIYISYLRGSPQVQTIRDFGVIFLKMVFLHIGFQLSGVYSVLFPSSSKLESS
jgi:hypothetical protein